MSVSLLPPASQRPSALWSKRLSRNLWWAGRLMGAVGAILLLTVLPFARGQDEDPAMEKAKREAATLAKVMRELQVRKFALSYYPGATVEGIGLFWLNCSLGTKAPPYPSDTFYVTDMLNPETARNLVRHVAGTADDMMGYFLASLPEGQEDFQFLTAPTNVPRGDGITTENYAVVLDSLMGQAKQCKYLLKGATSGSDGGVTGVGVQVDEPVDGYYSADDARGALLEHSDIQSLSTASYSYIYPSYDLKPPDDPHGPDRYEPYGAFSEGNYAKIDDLPPHCDAQLYIKVLPCGEFSNDDKDGAPVEEDGAYHHFGSLHSETEAFREEYPEAGLPDYVVDTMPHGWFTSETCAVIQNFKAPDGDAVECKCSSCDSASCPAGECKPIVTNSLQLEVSLGADLYGGKVGYAFLRAETPSPILATPAALNYALNASAAQTSATGLYARIEAPACRMDVSVIDAFSYQLTFFYKDTGGNVATTAYKTITISNPDASTTIYNRVQITEVTGTNTKTSTFVYSAANDHRQWTLASGNLSQTRDEGGWTTDSSIPATPVTTRVFSTEAKDLSVTPNKTLSKVEDTFQRFPWGEEKIKQVVDPQGAALQTLWTFGTTVNTNNYGRLTQVTYPDGSWEAYQYDASGRLYQKIAPFNDAAPGSAQNQCRVWTMTYGATNPVFTAVETVLGQEVARRYQVYDAANHIVKDIVCVIPGADWDAASNLVTVTRYYAGGVGLGSSQIKSVSRPDGTATLYSYGSINSGSQKQTIVSTGKPNSVSNPTSITDGTKTTTTVDSLGNLVVETTDDIASGLQLTSAASSSPDAFGRPQVTTYEDGSTETVSYDCCGMDSRTDRNGIYTSYTYDDAKRAKTETSAGITTTYVYDAIGQRTSTTRKGTDNSVMTLESAVYDVAGRQTSRTDALGKTTTYSEVQDSSNHRVRTTTNPENWGTVIETYQRDGQLLSVGGTAAHPASYAYGVDSADGAYRQTTLTDGGGSTTYTDMAGRAHKTVRGSAVLSENFFNAKGQLIKQVDADGVTALYAYNDRGEREVSAIDMDRNDAIDYGGTDRITKTVRSVTADHSGSTENVPAALRTVTSVWATDNSAIGQTIETIDASPSGKKNWQTRYGLLKTTETVCSSGGVCTTTVKAPDGTSTVSVSQNGRPVSQTRKKVGGTTVLSWMTMHYDAHGRMDKQTDSRTGDTIFTYYDNDRMLSSSQSGLTTYYGRDAMWRTSSQTLPDGDEVTYDHWLTGELKEVSGSRTYRQSYTYDAQGRMKTLKTYQGATSAGEATTTWNYDPASGLLISKMYADGLGTTYVPTASGRTYSRTWARGTVATYGYDNAGALNSIVYSGSGSAGTANVSCTYDRMGRMISATGGSGSGVTRSIAYQGLTPMIASDAETVGPTSGFSAVTGYDALLRRNAFQAKQGSTVMVDQGFDYAGTDASGRLNKASQGSLSATYGYEANSNADLVKTIDFKNGATSVMTTTKVYHPGMDRLESIGTTAGAITPASFAYGYNDAQQRNKVTLADGSYWDYGYDGLGQVTSASRKWSDDNSLVAGQQFGYQFDGIGNRTQTTTNGRTAAYTLKPNLLNQYEQRDVPGAIDVLGTADAAANVTVNNLAATRQKNTYFYKALSVANGASAVDQAIDVLAVRPGAGAGGEDVVSEQTGKVFVPLTPEHFVYDEDGNLTQDGHWAYTWDAENRLVAMEALGTMPATARRRLEFAYDDKWRRVQKKVYDPNDSAYVLSKTIKFLYDGWNLVAEIDGSNVLQRSYLWGKDLSGSLQGEGGAGGLLVITDHTPSAGTESHFVGYDGNGNVSTLVKASNGSISAQYEHGPFGEDIRATGVMAQTNSVQFSTKYTDLESGLLFYGYRYYSRVDGRWINRDPINERGSMNIYETMHNNLIDHIDALGLKIIPPEGTYILRSLAEVTYNDIQATMAGSSSISRGYEVQYIPAATCPCKHEELILSQALTEAGGDPGFDFTTLPPRGLTPLLPPGYVEADGKKGPDEISFIDAPQSSYNLEACTLCPDGTNLGCVAYTWDRPEGKLYYNKNSAVPPVRVSAVAPGSVWKGAIEKTAKDTGIKP